MAVGSTHAVAAGVAATDHDDVFAVRANLALELVARVNLVLLRQELHGVVHPIELTARHRQVTRLLGTARQQHGVKLGLQLLGADGFLGPVGDLGILTQTILARNQHASANFQAFGHHLLDAAVNQALVELEVGDAVAQQAAHTVVLFKQRHIVTSAHQLLGCGHASGTGANDSYLLAGLRLGRQGLDPAFSPGTVNDGVLNRLDANRFLVDVGHASRFTRRRADTARELWEVIGAVQRGDGVFPVALVHEVIEVRNDVVDRAAVVAKRCAAIHATRSLNLGLIDLEADDKLLVVLQAFGYGGVAFFNTLVFEKSGGLTHDVQSLKSCSLERFGSGAYLAKAASLLELACAAAACFSFSFCLRS